MIFTGPIKPIYCNKIVIDTLLAGILNGKLISKVTLKRFSSEQAMANELLSTIARLDFVEEGLQEFVLDNFSDERMFPFSESLIDLMV